MAIEWKLPLTTKNSLLLTTLGTIGKVFCPGIAGCAFASTIICLEPNLDLVLPQFLYYYLQSKENQISKLVAGSTVPMLTKSTLSEFPVFLPSLEEQKKILTQFQIVYNQIFASEIHYQDNLQKIIQKHLKIGDLLFQKHRDSTIRIKDQFQLICGRTPPSKEEHSLQKKNIPLEIIRNHPHRRAKTNYFLAIFRLRHSISKAIHDFFHQEGFYYVPTPIITSNDSEGAGELFSIITNEEEAFFPQSVHLTVSGQLHAEALAQGLGKVYTFGPCFRADPSQTTRHLAEFWMVEAEMTWAGLAQITDLAEKLIKYTTNYVLANNKAELEYFEKFQQKSIIKKLKSICDGKFQAINYEEGLKILEKDKSNFSQNNIFWGMDFQAEHEKHLCRHFGNQPLFILNYPQKLKPFYMKNNPDGKTVACFDLIFPEIGELIGGSVREDNYQIVDKAYQKSLDVDNLS
ncbi:21721_t:CDS:1 [Gigaspora margarita]|uniref:asparagine--tRNA ligase n=1 Tax=Gigaspora margarita TaxID=4874 RepID=A0ABM8VVA5_GIGMA|nr:21721_t:CDS:1 [Gigaspora margarita]